eukprot:TRINITY_DN34415_c0_g1_i1.p1 TRINITY_DN34415_c0_g1~~TRINITY_DN34415_c0_g1_i1.p1  ORF type:complete len:615 (-),score=45.10 TRINITY_DN34415_c0_g1_i1:131-1882(-)
MLRGFFQTCTLSVATEDDVSDEDSEESSDDDAINSHRSSEPQIVHGKSIWPDRWGMSRKQLRELLLRLRAEPLWHRDNNVYTLVNDFIVPWTSGSGLGYALLENRNAPKEVNVMVSHAFFENAEDFLETVLRATTEDDGIFICAFSLYQAEDGVGPSIAMQLGTSPRDSPFQQVLQHIRAQGARFRWHWHWRPVFEALPAFLGIIAVVTTLLPIIIWRHDFELALHRGVWSLRISICFNVAAVCCTSLYLLHKAIVVWLRRKSSAYAGRMIVVPNWEEDIYSRLWCVYEIFIASRLEVNVVMAPTLAQGGTVSCKHAVCNIQRDTKRIRSEIEQSRFSYEDIDSSVRSTMRGGYKHLVLVLLKYVMMQMLPLCALNAMKNPNLPELGVFLQLFVFYLGWTLAMYAYAKRCKGVLTVTCKSILFAFSVPIVDVSWHLWLNASGSWDTLWGSWSGCVLDEVASISIVYIGALCRPYPANFHTHLRIHTLVVLFVCMFTFSTLIAVARCTPSSCGNHPAIVAIALYSLFYVFSAIIPMYMIWTEAVHHGVKVKIGMRCHRLVGVLSWLIICAWVSASCWLVQTAIS